MIFDSCLQLRIDGVGGAGRNVVVGAGLDGRKLKH